MTDWIRYAIVPRGIHVILEASESTYNTMYLCKMFDPDGDFPNEYHILIDENNIYKSKDAAKRKQFKDKLRGFSKAP